MDTPSPRKTYRLPHSDSVQCFSLQGGPLSHRERRDPLEERMRSPEKGEIQLHSFTVLYIPVKLGGSWRSLKRYLPDTYPSRGVSSFPLVSLCLGNWETFGVDRWYCERCEFPTMETEWKLSVPRIEEMPFLRGGVSVIGTLAINLTKC